MRSKLIQVTVLSSCAFVLAACTTAENTTPSTAVSATTTAQRQGTDLGAAATNKNSPAGMDHSAMGTMQGMDHSKMQNMQGMDHGKMGNMAGMNHDAPKAMQGMDHGSANAASPGGSGHQHQNNPTAKHAHAPHGATAAGQPGNAANASRTVNVKALDTMRFAPQTVQVKAGETIRFVVTNVGKVPHEFVIATAQEQKEHAQMMQRMPGMKHEEANAVSLTPGETKTLVWQFGSDQSIELACHVPGHYPAGMVSKVSVTNTR